MCPLVECVLLVLANPLCYTGNIVARGYRLARCAPYTIRGQDAHQTIELFVVCI